MRPGLAYFLRKITYTNLKQNEGYKILIMMVKWNLVCFVTQIKEILFSEYASLDLRRYLRSSMFWRNPQMILQYKNVVNFVQRDFALKN